MAARGACGYAARHFYPMFAKSTKDGLNLIAEQYEIACDSRLSLSSRLEIDRDCRAHRGRHRHAAVFDLLIPRKRVLQHAAIGFTRPSEHGIDVGNIDIHLGTRGGLRRRCERRPAENETIV